MNQLTILFDKPRFPRARNTDASSSHEAAAKVERTGAAKAQAQEVLQAFTRFPMATTAELAQLANLNRTMVARRAPELATGGFLVRYEPGKDTVPCEVTGIKCVRWRVR